MWNDNVLTLDDRHPRTKTQCTIAPDAKWFKNAGGLKLQCGKEKPRKNRAISMSLGDRAESSDWPRQLEFAGKRTREESASQTGPQRSAERPSSLQLTMIDLWAHLSWEMPAACWPWKWVTLCCRAIPGGLQEGSGKSGLPEALGPPDLPLSSSPQSDVAFLFLYRMWVRFSHSLLSLSAFMCWFSVSQLSPPFLLSPTHSSSPVFEPSILPVCEDRAGPFSSFYHLQALATWRGHSQRH